jgi:ubiquinone/menaquinone biosynthesis C-methylase UbiE
LSQNTDPITSKSGLTEFYDDPEVVRTYLNRKAQPLGSVLHARQVGFLNQTIARLAPKRLLELAPGPARLSAEVGPTPFAVGMDWSPRMLAEAQRRTRAAGRPEWRFVRGDGFSLPFASGSFDLVYSVRFVRRFEVERRQAIYAEIRRVLRPGGHLILDAQNKLVAGPHREGRNDYPVYDELWLRDDLIAELEGAGFTPQHLEGIMRQFAWQWRLHRLRRFGLGGAARLLIRALEWTSDRNPSTWMVLSQMKA